MEVNEVPDELLEELSDEVSDEVSAKLIDDDVDKGYPHYLNSGEKKVDAMNAKIEAIRADPRGNHDNPMPVVAQDSYDIIQHPSLIQTPLWTGFESAKRVFDDLGLKKGKTVVDGYKAYAKNGIEKRLVGENYVTIQGEDVIIAKCNNMQSQNIALNPLRWNELTYSSLAKVRGKPLDDIKFIIRDGINNEGTKNVIDRVHADVPYNVVNDKGTFDLTSPNTQEVEAATALVGTPNGSGIYFVIDFPKAFGYQKIVRVHTWSAAQMWAMAFELGPM